MVKSRTFSQISAKARRRSVPSCERLFTSSYMFDASCRRALRISILQSHCGCESLLVCSQSLAHPYFCRSADHVVAVHGRVQRDARKKVSFKLRAELLQLFERKTTQFATFLKTITHRLAYSLVRLAKGNSLVHEVGCGRHSIQKTSFAGATHAFGVEPESRGKPSQQGSHSLRRIGGGENGLLALLQIL